MNAAPLLELRGVRAGYDGVEVLHGVDLRVQAGEVVAILGPNGAGKTTLISVLSGLLAPSAGSIRFGGRDLTGTSAATLAAHGLCCVPEGRGVFANLTVSEHLWLAAGPHDRKRVEARCYEIFPSLEAHRSQPAGSLSGGEQQMLALARALVSDPAILIVDELSMGLAPLVVADLYDRIAALAIAGTTIIVVEQFVTSVAPIASRGVVLVGGTIIMDGPMAQITPRLADAYFATSEESRP